MTTGRINQVTTVAGRAAAGERTPRRAPVDVRPPVAIDGRARATQTTTTPDTKLANPPAQRPVRGHRAQRAPEATRGTLPTARAVRRPTSIRTPLRTVGTTAQPRHHGQLRHGGEGRGAPPPITARPATVPGPAGLASAAGGERTHARPTHLRRPSRDQGPSSSGRGTDAAEASPLIVVKKPCSVASSQRRRLYSVHSTRECRTRLARNASKTA